jgi:hypothetical protein
MVSQVNYCRFLLAGILAIHPNIVVGSVAAQRDNSRLGGGVHAGNRAHLRQQIALERLTAVGGELSNLRSRRRAIDVQPTFSTDPRSWVLRKNDGGCRLKSEV